MSWIERAADRSDAAERARSRRVKQAQQIVLAARTLLYDSGEGFTIQQLVDEAGIALQTFYRYFPSKDELFLAVLEETIAESCAQFEESGRSITDPLARLEHYVIAPLVSLRDGPSREGMVVTSEHFRLQRTHPEEVARATAPFTELVARVLVEARDAGLVDPLDIDRDSWVINELVRSAFHSYAFSGLGPRADVILEHLWAFCLRGLGGVPQETPVAKPATNGSRRRRGAPS